MKTISEINSLNEFIEQAKSLRIASEDAEARFLLFLHDFEVHREDLWKTAGLQSYESFLTSNHLVQPGRYRNRHPYRQFCSGAEVVSDPVAIGAGATRAAASFKKPTVEAVRKFEENAVAFREVHGTAPSEQHASTWVKQLDEASPRVVRQATRMRQLEAENQQLRAENKDLKRKLQKAEKEIDRLRPVAAA